VQRYFRKLRSKDTLMTVLPNNHPFQDFFGHVTVKKSINALKLNQMEAAIKAGNWNDSIFKDTGYNLELAYTTEPNHDEMKRYTLYLYYSNDKLNACFKNKDEGIETVLLSDKLVKHKANIINKLSATTKKLLLTTEEENIIYNIVAYYHEAIHRETVPYLALSLFINNKITQQQMNTILEHHQTCKDYPIKKSTKY
jgi:hypothetical protein